MAGGGGQRREVEGGSGGEAVAGSTQHAFYGPDWRRPRNAKVS